jgi:perosamine synthetase
LLGGSNVKAVTLSERIEISLPAVGEEEWLALRSPLDSGWLTQGAQVAQFESEFARRHQVSHALATTSCTTALHLMLASAGIGPGDEVIVPSFTWVSTANAVVYCGATPVLVDVDPITYNISIDDALRHLTKRTKAVIAVHLFGLCANTVSLRDALPKHVLLFEDAACAAGASLNGISAGALGDAAAFSFHPRKSITTGEGGMLATNNAEVASTAAKMRNHGAEISEEQRHNGPQPYLLPDFNLLGFNYRMTDLQGAIGVVQLRKLDSFIAERQRAADLYDEQIGHLDVLQMPARPSNGVHAWQAFVLRVRGTNGPEERNRIMGSLESLGISTRPGTHAIHSLGYYREKLKKTDEDLPGAALCRDTTVAIPLHNRMTENDYARVIDAIKSVVH